MFDLEISRKFNRNFILMALVAVLASFIFGVFKGPAWMEGFAIIGLASSLLNGFFHLRDRRRYPGWGATSTFLGLSVLFLISAAVLNHLFLSRLSDNRLKIPALAVRYTSPDKSFSVKLPVGWRAEAVMDRYESGLRLAPDGFDAYMGAAEVQIRVRTLSKPPAHAGAFLLNFVNSVSPKERVPQKAKAFSFYVEPGKSLGKAPGVWTVLDVSRFWIPVRQTTFFGIKNGRYLCSVSVTGLKAHDTLHQVVSLGLFETLKPVSSPR